MGGSSIVSRPVDERGLDVPVLELGEAVARFVRAGSTVWLGNFGAQLFAVGEELIRQGLQNLHVVAPSGGLLLDRLLGAGVPAEVTFAHCWSPVGPAPAWAFRRAWEDGSDVRWHELPLGALNAALTAAAWAVPFLPVRLPAETGYLAADWSRGLLAEVETPFGRTPVVRALPLDVAFVGADVTDGWGNAVLGTPRGEAIVAAQAASTVVVVAEELRAPLYDADVPGVLVDAVVVAPGAVRPDGVPGRYQRAVDGYAALVARSRRGSSA
jgi:glutaconate CoA-transferase subunit A